MRDGSVLAVSAELRRGPYSCSGFLRELLCWEIGTVSTRYKLIASLLRQGLIHKAQEQAKTEAIARAKVEEGLKAERETF